MDERITPTATKLGVVNTVGADPQEHGGVLRQAPLEGCREILQTAALKLPSWGIHPNEGVQFQSNWFKHLLFFWRDAAESSGIWKAGTPRQGTNDISFT